ncbi:hypothetical protein LTR47_006123 [Exophiala xenobiotica]|nr:hypothetical protein LTR72_009663 [Exophiala xenobiotica]KAK5232896.1 hypothetical protein LTR47_006123 [Exophiala xenobiotica]KAK5255364.1 hypothetical protein LTS06_000385 [Exophiala xenobiotica]KAK5261475.1 hypothetical protein LTR40_002140 [Exophiala xenobiotica]KAK5287987.1 hypothetical protein LTR14_008770 [Exophiala xenobiotica]
MISGGSVAKLLLQYPDQYAVRALTRNPSSAAARKLSEAGAEVVQGDLTDPSTLPAAFDGCWGAFVVTNFYDSDIKDDPASEEEQGKNAARAALDAGVQCFVWSTLPSSLGISKGEVCCEIYEGKHRVDGFIKNLGLPATFVYTGNFYENMILRGHVRKSQDGAGLEFRQPIIRANTKLHMLWVQRDLSAIVKAILDSWDVRKQDLLHQYLYAMDAIHTPNEVCQTIERAMSSTPLFRMDLTADAQQLAQKVMLLVTAETAFCERMSTLAKFAGTAMKLKSNAEVNLLQHPFHFPPHMRRLRHPLGNHLSQVECNIPEFNLEAVARDINQLLTDAYKKEAIVDWCDGYVESLRYTMAKDIVDDLQQCRQQASAFLVMWLEPIADVRGPTSTVAKAVNDFEKLGKKNFMVKRRDYWMPPAGEPRTEGYWAPPSHLQRLGKTAELYAKETTRLRDSLRALVVKIDFLLTCHPAFVGNLVDQKDMPSQGNGSESVEWLLTSPERLPERLRSLVSVMLEVALEDQRKLFNKMARAIK